MNVNEDWRQSVISQEPSVPSRYPDTRHTLTNCGQSEAFTGNPKSLKSIIHHVINLDLINPVP